MSAVLDPGVHACDMELRGGEAHVPDTDVDVGHYGGFEQSRDRLPPEGRLQCEPKSVGNGLLQETLPLIPCRAIRLTGRDSRIGC